MSNNSKEINYQIGANDINQDTVLEGSESIEFDFENAAIFKRLADDIYDSPEAGIREPLQNALTAVKRTIEQGYISKSEGVIEIEVRDGDRVSLVLQDNGIGISESVLDKVLTVIGRSQNRDNGTVSGKYGMGFLACYKLVGANGGFIMHTNSRETDNPPLSGIWKPGLFEKDKEGFLPSVLSEDDYGTRFEFKLREDIDIEKIREWVRNHAQWATLPIIYREYNKDGDIEFDDEFGIKKLQSAHTDSNFTVTIETDYYTAICSREQEGRTLLINSPIDRNSSYDSDNTASWNIKNPHNMDIRLKNENGIVVKGPNKGLMPVSEAEYKNLTDERKENYIPESKLNTPAKKEEVMESNIDITIPQPTGTRDTLERNSYFWAYLEQKMLQEIKSKFKLYFDNITSSKDFLTLPIHKKKYITNTISILNITLSSKSEIKSDFKDKFDISLSDELAKFIKNSTSEVHYIKRGASAVDASKKGDSSNVKKTVGAIISELDEDSNVFMGVSMNQTKMNAVWEENEDNVIIRVDKSNVYDLYNELYNWKQLRYVKENLDLDSLSQSTKDILLNNKKKNSSSSVKNKDVKNRKITIHKKNAKDKSKLSSIYAHYNKLESETLVLFLSNSDYNVSDYYNITSNDVSIANSLVKMWDYLQDSQNITTIENWIDKISNYSFETSDGIYTANELSETSKTIVFHVNDTNTNILRNENIMKEMKNISQHATVQGHEYSYNELANVKPSETIYIPITSTKLNHLRVLFKEDKDMKNIYTINTSDRTKIGERINLANSDLYWYTWSLIPEWRDSEQIKTLKSSNYPITEGWIYIIDNLKENNTTIDLDRLPNPAQEITYKTSEGEKSICELNTEYNLILVHILEPEIALLFKDDTIIKDIKSYVYNNEIPKYSPYSHDKQPEKIKNKYDIDNTVYVPINRGEYKNLNSYHNKSNELYTISTKNVYSTCDANIPQDTAAYASAVLSDEISGTIIPDNPSEMKSLSSGGLEFINSMKNL